MENNQKKEEELRFAKMRERFNKIHTNNNNSNSTESVETTETEQQNKNIKEIAEEVKKVAQNQVGTLTEIEIYKLKPYEYKGEGQPFNEYNSKKYEDVKNSIILNGLHEPIIVRKIANEDKYEIIAGHNRTKIFKELGREKIPALIVDCDDDKARLIMVETNIMKRDEITPMERARAYKIQKDIYSKKKYGENENVVIKTILEESNTSNSTFYRYLALNNLIPQFQDLVENKFNIRNAEQISFLKKEEQENLYNLLNDKKIKVNDKKLKILKNLSNENDNALSEDEIVNCFKENLKPNIEISINFNNEEIEKYFSANIDKKEIKEIIIKALDKYFN